MPFRVVASPLPIQLPAKVPGEAPEEGLSVEAPARRGRPEKQPSPTLAFAGTQGENQWMEGA